MRTCARVSWVVEVAVAELWCATMAAAAMGLHRQQRKRGEEKQGEGRWSGAGAALPAVVAGRPAR